MAVDVYFAFDGRAGDEGEEEWGYTPVQKMTAGRFDSTKNYNLVKYNYEMVPCYIKV